MYLKSSKYLCSQSKCQYGKCPEVYSPEKCITLPEPLFIQHAVAEAAYYVIHRIDLEDQKRRRLQHSLCIPHDRSKPYSDLQDKYIDELSQIAEENYYRRAEIRQSKNKYDITYNVIYQLYRIYRRRISHAGAENK